jgi:hypothetical protein
MSEEENEKQIKELEEEIEDLKGTIAKMELKMIKQKMLSSFEIFILTLPILLLGYIAYIKYTGKALITI